TVIATESYEQFAEQLQTEVERDTGIRFGIVESHQFAGIPVADADGKTAPMGVERSKTLWTYLQAGGHLDTKGKIQESLKKALNDGTLLLP
ncbi:restriction endonuclease subunit R, partial [Klebsiella pneumoniae]|nr:restriction endonuclease subunit R [Klebsiella pneumoniae]